MWGTIAIVGVAAIVVAVLLTRKRKTTVEEIAPYRVDLAPALVGFIRAVNRVNRTDDAHYVQALEALRSARQEVLSDTTRRLVVSPDAPFGLRHSTLLAVSALRDPGALDLLSAVALNPQPLPPGEPKTRTTIDSHDGGEIVTGTVLALSALEGIEALADDGLEAALEQLTRAAAINSNAVRGVALTALAARPERREYLERAKAALPRGLEHLSQLRRVSVGDVPQVKDPRAHLSGPEKGGPSAPAIAEHRKQGENSIAPVSGAPTAGRR
jgi:hypothetical protein